MKTFENKIPKDGIAGLKENWKVDFLSGFMVFLLAMPLSLGIADQSKFPVVFGLLTAIIGGMIVSMIAGSPLTIKGPAAGLAPIVAGAVVAFSANETLGWQMTCGAIVVAAVIQILFGLLKFGKMSNFFPSSAIHGMLAAIGILIFSKQIHNLFGIKSSELKGLNPLGLLMHIPQSIAHLDLEITCIGLLSLVIVFGAPYLKNKWLKAIPVPVLVLSVAIPLALVFNLKNTDRGYSMIKIGNFIQQFTEGLQGKNISFDGLLQMGVFVKYVLLFSLIGSIESLLTVKAIDGLDPYHRKSNFNKDLIAVGFGNLFSGLLGGLPMISEVARSSANVNNGAKTRWANFFHGISLLIAVLLVTPFLEMIPKAALAALLLGVAYRLASPKEFINTYKIGKDQLAVFITTIAITIVEDLLVGVISGIVLQLILNIYFSKNIKKLFVNNTNVVTQGKNDFIIHLNSPLNFSNFMGFKKQIELLPISANIKLDLSKCDYIDHDAAEQLRHLEEDIHNQGGALIEFNNTHLLPLGTHRLSALRNKLFASKYAKKIISQTKQDRLLFSEQNNFLYYEFGKNIIREVFSKFQLYKNATIIESVMTGQLLGKEIRIADIKIKEELGLNKKQYTSTIALISLKSSIPNFILDIEDASEYLRELVENGRDIDFKEFPDFSDYYLLRGEDENQIRTFFTDDLITFFEANKEYLIEVKDNILLVKTTLKNLSNEEIKALLQYINNLLLKIDNA